MQSGLQWTERPTKKETCEMNIALVNFDDNVEKRKFVCGSVSGLIPSLRT